MYIKILFSDEIPGGARRHTARAYIFRPYINTRIIMNARSPAPFSLPLCVQDARGRARRVSSSLYALLFFPPELLRFSFPFRQEGTATSPSSSSWSDTSGLPPTTDESGTGRLTPVVASPGDLAACFGRVSPPADLRSVRFIYVIYDDPRGHQTDTFTL